MKKDKLQNILCALLPIVFVVVLAVGLMRAKAEKEELSKLKSDYENSINTSANSQGNSNGESSEKEESGNKDNEFDFTKKAILFLGDGVSVEGEYQEIVAQELQLKDYVNGAKSGLLLGEMDDDITEDTVKDKDIVIVFGGTNDYSRGKELGILGDSEDSETFYGSVQGIIDNLKSLKEDLEIVFLTPLKHGYLEGQPSYPNANYNGDYLDDYVDAIKEVCDKNHVKYIDAFNESGINENNVGEYTYNNIILNGSGHELVGKFIGENLKKIFND